MLLGPDYISILTDREKGETFIYAGSYDVTPRCTVQDGKHRLIVSP